ncbi:Cna B-type domain-containing protein [Alloscardovia omnicolens]|uniref:Cna B-type domain-containing protein n=1 Tax=Alloscardovia omnicolens TaxID=419015 RepID=UPI003A61DF1E
MGGGVAHAEGAAKQVKATVSDLQIQNLNGETQDAVYKYDRFYLAMKWDASSLGADVHKGDYFDAKLPEQMVYPEDQATFPLYAEDGSTVIANAHVTPNKPSGGTEPSGGTVRVIFTDWVEGKENIKGNLRLAAQFNHKLVKDNEKNKFDVSVGATVKSVEVTVKGRSRITNETLVKWGAAVSGQRNVASWWTRINYNKANLKNAVISDQLSNGDGSEKYIPDTFELWRVTFDEQGDVKTYLSKVDLSDKLKINPDGKSFSLNLGDTSDQYFFTYRTTYTIGTTLHNKITLTSHDVQVEHESTFVSADANGDGTGNLANKIKLIKVDAEDKKVTLANATFQVTRPDGSTFDLTTGADGTVTSGALTSGTYKVKEKTAPQGYVKSDKEYTLTVNASRGAIETISNEPVKTKVSVEKKWVGPQKDSVTVRLLADNKDTGKKLTLSAQNGWKGTFEGLRQYNADGSKIVYTVSEDPIKNYSSDITGDAVKGFVITNTNNEVVCIPVMKLWGGPVAGPVTVRLLADGKDTGKKLTLSEANNWSDTFANVPKYNADGSKIVYTVSEDPVENYSSQITGDAVKGFTILNSNTEEVDVPVKKVWKGPAKDSVTVRLLADGKDTGKTVKLDKAGKWEGSFKNLPKYNADGSKIVYTVSEDPIKNYSSQITGDAVKGFTITNMNTEKVSVGLAKKWDDKNNQDGKRPTSVTAHLLADGKDTGKSIKLDESNMWRGQFNDLPKYNADGSKIVYTVSEDDVADYTAKITGDVDSGFTITNTHMPETVKVKVSKTWIGKKASSVTVRLLADGVDTGKTLKLDESTQWQGTFTDLPKFKDGVEITYTISEDSISGYSSKITGNAKTEFTVTNTEIPPLVPSTPTTPKKTVKKALAQTGADISILAAITALALVGAACLGAVVLMRRRK